MGLIQFGGHLPKGEYDVDHDGEAGQADAALVYDSELTDSRSQPRGYITDERCILKASVVHCRCKKRAAHASASDRPTVILCVIALFTKDSTVSAMLTSFTHCMNRTGPN